MSEYAEDIHHMHKTFGFKTKVADMEPETLSKLFEFRIKFLEEELNETKDAETADDVVDGLIDLIVVALGTLDLFEVDADKAWDRVHLANMSKVAGVKPNRPNPLGLPDLNKPEGWTAPTHVDNVGLLAKVFT